MWLPKEGKFILLFSNKISESGISAWATTRGRPYEIILMQPNNNLPVCFLLGHPGKPIPEYFPGSGVAIRQTIIYRLSGHGKPCPYRNLYSNRHYNLQSTRYRQATSADDRFLSAQCKPATAPLHSSLFTKHISLSGTQTTISDISPGFAVCV